MCLTGRIMVLLHAAWVTDFMLTVFDITVMVELHCDYDYELFLSVYYCHII